MRSIPQPYKRIWLILVVALFAIPAVAVAATILVSRVLPWWRSTDDAEFVRGHWRAPPQGLLSSSMAVEPVPGWRTKVSSIGLPDETDSAPYKFGVDENPFLSDPYVGNMGDHAYFMLGNIDSPTPQWFLVGIDVRTGDRTFAPVPLATDQARPRCYLNGPDALLCLTDDGKDGTAWIINSHNGRVEYTGPTALTVYSSQFIMRQIGLYAVALKPDSGIYGVGPTAETTWFVPGNGTVNDADPHPLDLVPPTLTNQPAGRGAARTITFSLKDGTVIRPTLADNKQQQRSVTYPGGFAAEVAAPRELGHVQFFDDSGAREGPNSAPGELGQANGLPLVNLAGGGWALFDAPGELLMQQATPTHANAEIVGDMLLISGDGPGDKRQFDMTSGTEMKPCDLPEGYFASDGRVALGEHGYADTVRTTTAVDLTTCDTVWKSESPVGTFHRLWRINTTLVQLSDDGTELMSLVAPG